MTPAQQALLERSRRQGEQIFSRSDELTAAIWAQMLSFRDADIDWMVERVSPIASAAQTAMAISTEQYLIGWAADAGISTAPGFIDASTQALRGVTDREVYERIGPTIWGRLSEGASFEDAVDAGFARLQKVMQTNIQLARTHTARNTMKRQDGVVGYRRVPRGMNSCALCLVASTQRYHTDDLMPIHPGCACGVESILGGSDPGSVLDQDALNGVHAAIKERFGAFSDSARQFETPEGELLHYRDILVTHRHGEIGPVLGIRGQKFTGPSDL